MNDIIFEILKTVIVIAVILITRYAIPLFKAKLEASKYNEISRWVGEAVFWAEQTIKDSGAIKKDKVMEFLTALAYEKNINISVEQLDVLVESAVKAMKGFA